VSETLCGNERHPNGPWHAAAPLPSSWQYLRLLDRMRNRKRWGCPCPRDARVPGPAAPRRGITVAEPMTYRKVWEKYRARVRALADLGFIADPASLFIKSRRKDHRGE
jgi:hypothetical protein